MLIKKGVNSALNGKSTILSSDIKTANELPKVFDSDIDNYWTNPSEINKISVTSNKLFILFQIK